MTHSTAMRASPVVLDVSAVLAASTSSTTPTTPNIELRLASYPADMTPLLALIREYMAWLNVDLCGRGLEKELPHFEALFTPPSGLFVLAFVDDALAGCAGLLVLHGHTAEVKRVYVRPAHRGLGLGEALVRRLPR
jgi:carbonic anhydrase